MPMRTPLLIAITVGLIWSAGVPATLADEHWPQFRGPAAAGVSDDKPAPTEWSISDGTNVLWRTPVPGLAHSSPIVWGDRLFVTTAVPLSGSSDVRIGLYGDGDSADDMVEHAFKLLCLDRATGKVLWERTCHQGVPRAKRHTKATHCNSTPATDGRVVVALFGSEGVFAYSLDGELRWKKNLGLMDVGPHNATELQWGFASSPIIHEGKLVLQCDIKQDPFLAALDVSDGRELWRVARDDVPGWCTPTAYGSGADARILVNGCRHIGAYRLDDGREIWRMSGGGGIPVPAPVLGDGVAYFTSNHRPLKATDPAQPIFAVRLNASGDVTLPAEATSSEHVAWLQTRRGAYMQTPLLYRGLLFNCKDNGDLAAYDARTGEEKWRQRLSDGGEGFTASAVATDGKLYYTSEEGRVRVLRAGPTYELLAQNELGESCLATPAVSRGVIYFRTRGHVIAIGQR